MKKYISQTVSIVTLASLVAACGGGGGSSSGARNRGGAPGTPGTRVNEEAVTDGSNIQGSYKAVFSTLNPQVNGTVPGSLTILRKEEKLYFYLRLFAGKPQTWHPQNIYLGSRCPTAADDTNGDGYIDINEGNKVWGNVLVPLDHEPTTQRGGRNFYPMSDLSGSYFYERIVNFNSFFADLKAADPTPEDNISKLAPTEGLSLIGKVVVVQGVDAATILPETVGTAGRYRNFQTLPVVCGVIQKSDEAPGNPDATEIPGEVGSAEEWTDAPAPADEIDLGTGREAPTPAPATNNNEADRDGADSDDGGGEDPQSPEQPGLI